MRQGVSQSGSKRDIRLDALRGLCLAVMMIDHLPPNWMARILYELPGYVSAMEGFILISGLTCAIAYFDPARRRERLWARCRTLYLWYVAICVVIWTAALWNPELTARRWSVLLGHFQSRPLHAVMTSLAMLHRVTHIGILQMYIAFLLPAPWILGWLRSPRAAGTVGISLAIWAGVQAAALWPPPGPEWLFNGFWFLGWQVLFFGGMWVGVLRREGSSLSLLSNRWLLAACAGIAVAGFVLKHQGGFFPALPRVFQYEAWPISKEHLGVVRLVNTAAIAVLLSRIPAAVYDTIGATPVTATLLRSLVYLGQHSLAVFGWHVLVTYYAYLQTGDLNALGRVQQTAVIAAAIASLLVAAWVHDTAQRRFFRKVSSAGGKPQQVSTA